MTRRRLILGALVGLGYGLIPEWFGYGLGAPIPDLFVDLSVGVVSIWVGLVAWRFRPDDRTGALLCLLGVTWFFGSYGAVPVPTVAALGTAFQGYHFLVVVLLVLWAGPGRGFGSTAGRAIIVATAAVLVARTASRLFLVDPLTFFPGCQGCTANPFLVWPNQSVYNAIEGAVPWLLAACDLAALSIVLARFAAAAGLGRRLLVPALTAALISSVTLVTDAVRREVQIPPDLFAVLKEVFFYGRLVIPLAFLLGVIERRMARLGVADLVVELGASAPRDRLRDALRRALGDPSLEVTNPTGDDVRDPAGAKRGTSSTTPGDSRPARAVTPLLRGGQEIASIMHDPALSTDPELVSSVGAAVGLALENEQLANALREQLEEIRASRRRIVDAADAERRRVERDIHDGAQQRLMALLIDLRLARSAVGRESEAALEGRIDGLIHDLGGATDELRELARGVRPAILADAGLSAALRALAQRSTIPLDLDLDLDRRLDPAVESAAYFVAAEALTNIARHANATAATLSLGLDETGSRLRLSVSDDGTGGARDDRGSGVRGLRDRVEALGGRLDLESVPAHGTRLSVEIPCGS